MSGRFDSLFDVLHTAIDTHRMASDASAVAAYRLWGLAGAWTLPRHESTVMVQEKPAVLIDAMIATGRAAWAGKSPNTIMRAGLEPVSERVRSNRKRLSEVGPRRPGPL